MKQLDQHYKGNILKIDYIRLSKEMIEKINYLQFGGTVLFDHTPSMKDYEPKIIVNFIKRLDSMYEFIFDEYHCEQICDAEKVMASLCLITEIKDLYNTLKINPAIQYKIESEFIEN